MGASWMAWMLPGSVKSAVRAPGVGLTTETTSALLRLAFTASASSVCRWMRGTMPMTSSTARPNRPRRARRRARRLRRGEPRGANPGAASPSSMSLLGTGPGGRDAGLRQLRMQLAGREGRPAPQQTVDDRDDEEGGHGGEREAADHRAPEGGVLLGALAQPEGHRQHADDHREGGHQHRAEPDVARG